MSFVEYRAAVGITANKRVCHAAANYQALEILVDPISQKITELPQKNHRNITKMSQKYKRNVIKLRKKTSLSQGTTLNPCCSTCKVFNLDPPLLQRISRVYFTFLYLRKIGRYYVHEFEERISFRLVATIIVFCLKIPQVFLSGI